MQSSRPNQCRAELKHPMRLKLSFQICPVWLRTFDCITMCWLSLSPTPSPSLPRSISLSGKVLLPFMPGRTPDLSLPDGAGLRGSADEMIQWLDSCCLGMRHSLSAPSAHQPGSGGLFYKSTVVFIRLHHAGWVLLTHLA